jgi:hypothetical protein
MRAFRWTAALVAALVPSGLVTGCDGGTEPGTDHVIPTGRYSYSIGPDEGWGPAISLPSGQFEIRLATPDSLVLIWAIRPTEPLGGVLRVAHFDDGAYRLTIIGDPWTVDYRFWLEIEGVRCDGDVTPTITESTSCRIERLGDLTNTGQP